MNIRFIDSERSRRSAELLGLRKKKGITQLELSIFSGLTIMTICRIESGKSGWKIDSEIIYREAINQMIKN